MSTNPSGARIDRPTSSADDLVSDASGVLALLLSAKLSLQAHAAEPACIDSLTRCIYGLRSQFNLSDRELPAGLVGKQTNMAEIFRLLDYVEDEMRERLRDAIAADELKHCVELLGNARTLGGGRPNEVRNLGFSEISLSIPKTALS